MTPDERNLIMGLFDRMRSFGAVEKEREAEALINAEVRKIPDSAYMLVQSVLVGEQTLAGAQERIQQLETRVRDLEARGAAPQQSSGGSFLGGLFGGGSKPQPATSVPTSRAPAGGPWGQPAPAPQYQQAPVQQGGYAPQAAAAPQRAGGGFMAQAMTTAAGVAGGMLAANAISNMMGGGHHGHSSSGSSAYDQAQADADLDASQDATFAQGAAEDVADDNNDPGTSNTSDDGGGWGGDSGTDA